MYWELNKSCPIEKSVEAFIHQWADDAVVAGYVKQTNMKVF